MRINPAARWLLSVAVLSLLVVLGLSIWLSARLRNHYRTKRFAAEHDHAAATPVAATLLAEVPTDPRPEEKLPSS